MFPIGVYACYCNAYLFPSYFDDWVEPGSMVGLITVMHADIGTRIYYDRSPRELREASIYFFKFVYVPPTSSSGLYGDLEELPPMGFGTLDWPLPDMGTSEAFRAKLRRDFLAALKPNSESRRSHIQ
jgi:hypothetical protein